MMRQAALSALCGLGRFGGIVARRSSEPQIRFLERATFRIISRAVPDRDMHRQSHAQQARIKPRPPFQHQTRNESSRLQAPGRLRTSDAVVDAGPGRRGGVTVFDGAAVC